MKKFCAAAVLAGTAGLAFGQSSVTLYGIVDIGVEYYNNAAKGGTFVGMPTLTGEVPSRFGLRGVEDLGGGYKTFFVLESGRLPRSRAGPSRPRVSPTCCSCSCCARIWRRRSITPAGCAG